MASTSTDTGVVNDNVLLTTPEQEAGGESSTDNNLVLCEIDSIVQQENETLEQKLEKIPKVDFIESVDAFMLLPENAQDAPKTLRKCEEVHQQLKMSEERNLNAKERLEFQLEKYSKALEVIEEMKIRNSNNESLSTHFHLTDHVLVKAKVKPHQKIGLWLGANVMLEYDIEEAEGLLRANNEKASEMLKMTNVIIDTIGEQVSTIEVNMVRILNWDVLNRKQLEKEQFAAAATTGKNKK